MDVDLIFKIAGIGIVISVLNLVLIGSKRDDQALLTTLIGLVVVLAMVMKHVQELFDTIKYMFQL